MTEAITSVGAKGTTRSLFTTMVFVKRLMHACPPHVSRMIQCMVFAKVEASRSIFPCHLSSITTTASPRVTKLLGQVLIFSPSLVSRVYKVW